MDLLVASGCVTPSPCCDFAVTNGQLQQLSQTSETSSSISSYSSGPVPGAVNGLGTATLGPPARTVDVAISTEDGPRRSWARERAERAMQTEPATEGLPETRRTVRPPELLRDTAIRGQSARELPGTHPRRTFTHSPKTALLLALSRPRQPITRSQSDLTVAGKHWGKVPRVGLSPGWGPPPTLHPQPWESRSSIYASHGARPLLQYPIAPDPHRSLTATPGHPIVKSLAPIPASYSALTPYGHQATSPRHSIALHSSSPVLAACQAPQSPTSQLLETPCSTQQVCLPVSAP